MSEGAAEHPEKRRPQGREGDGLARQVVTEQLCAQHCPRPWAVTPVPAGPTLVGKQMRDQMDLQREGRRR